MKRELQFDFSIERENRTIEVTKEFEADLKTVWDAWTKPELLDQWWAPKPWKAETRSMDFKVGGKWVYAMVGPEGEKHWSKSVYTAISNLKSFSSSDTFIDENEKQKADMPENTWENQFSEKDGCTTVHTRLTFERVEDLDENLKMGFEEGFTAGLENLDELLEKLKK